MLNRVCNPMLRSLVHLPPASRRPPPPPPPFCFSRYGRRLDHRRLDHHVDRIHTLCVSLPRCSASVPGPIRPPTCNASDRGQGIFAHLLILLNSTVMRQLSQFLNPGASLPELWSPPSFVGPSFHRLPVRTAVVPSYCTRLDHLFNIYIYITSLARPCRHHLRVLHGRVLLTSHRGQLSSSGPRCGVHGARGLHML